MTKIMNDLKGFKSWIETASANGNKVIEQLINAIKPTIPDIRATLGGVESGIDTINFMSDSHIDMGFPDVEDGKLSLDIIIEQVFPQFKYPSVISVDCWCGVYVNAEEADKITDALITLRDGVK